MVSCEKWSTQSFLLEEVWTHLHFRAEFIACNFLSYNICSFMLSLTVCHILWLVYVAVNPLSLQVLREAVHQERFDCTNLSEFLTPPLNFLECYASDPLHWNLLVWPVRIKMKLKCLNSEFTRIIMCNALIRVIRKILYKTTFKF